jgi:hypothetical protein
MTINDLLFLIIEEFRISLFWFPELFYFFQIPFLSSEFIRNILDNYPGPQNSVTLGGKQFPIF